MAVTRSSASARAHAPSALAPGRAVRGFEMLWLAAASAVLLGGLWLVYQAKTRPLATAPAQAAVDLRSIDRREQLLPLLNMYSSAADRQFAARKIWEYLGDAGGRLPNVGALARIRVREREILSTPKLEAFRRRVEGRRPGPDETIPLLTSADLAHLKPFLIVRTAGEFRSSLLLWSGLFVVVFWVVHLFWRVRGFDGEAGFLPALMLLSGIGLVLMVSLRDPLRDSLTFANFAQGVIAGCALMAAASFVDIARAMAGFSFVPLAGSLLLSAALILFGSGPGTSDAKVNLLGTQPVEAIKILLVLFLAGYFARHWELLRELRERRPALARLGRWVEIPRLEYVMPVVVSIAIALLFFFLQKDLGPALVFSCVFLVLYAVARNRFQLAAFGMLLLVSGFAVGYFLGHPHTVEARVEMWLSPWDNTVHGGDQVVHSLWAMATGGPTGTGLGLGEPGTIPAGNTDLILSVAGEELGFAGLAAVFGLYAVLLYLGLRIALRSPNDYAFFLSLGLVLLIALQALLIAGGILDLVPLSGVVTPFLSYGRTSMLANFAIFGMLLSISRQGARGAVRTEPFHQPVRWVAVGLAVCAAAVMAKAAYVQVLRADPIAGAGTLVVQADGARRYQYNPRITEIARSIPRGAIFDRNGLPLATSKWQDLEDNRSQLAAIGVDIDKLDRRQPRYYPLGPAAYHLLGDLRTRANWSARNSSLVERDSAVQLQGYDDRARVVEVRDPRTGGTAYTVKYDYRELLPLLRHRWEPENPDVKRILTRERDVHMSVDARLQVAAAEILARHLKQLGKDAGSLVTLDPDTGDLLASVSLPAPALPAEAVTTEENPGPLLDRARYGTYPPGSTFKVVTAMAALRLDPALAGQAYSCVRLPDGRVGNYIGRSKRPIRDDVQDRTPHGTVNLERGLVVSCNAYFAQLATYKVGPQPLLDTANLLGISVANPPTAAKLRDALPQAGYGQGQVVATPFQMARAAATVAAGGKMPFGRWVLDASNARVEPPRDVLAPNLAAELARDMREVVTQGTGRRVAGAAAPIAGKTGTAELAGKPSHAWFIGFAPYGVPDARRIAFCAMVEHGQYGGTAAAPIAADLVAAAARLGLFKKGDQ